MKRYWIIVCSLLISVLGLAQPVKLPVTVGKTTSLVFPFPILHVDRGTTDILVQPVQEASTILLVKAAHPEFPETNLSVVTADGSVYAFTVIYNKEPDQLLYRIPVQREANLATYANGILDNPATVKGIRDLKFDICARVQGIYIRDAVLYLQLLFCNGSSIDYDFDQIRFYIRDKRKNKRTAVQELALDPLHVSGNSSHIRNHDFTMLVVALDKFTIPDAKVFRIQVTEKNGGRHLLLKINNRDLIRAIPLPDLR